MAWLHIATCILGLAAGVLLFARLAVLDGGRGTASSPPKVSIIIPARNEASALPALLGDIRGQSLPPWECICVDDCSTDGTAAAVEAAGVTLLRVRDKPEGWTGKSYACHLGAGAAGGDLLLFLDADVRLAPEALARLLGAYEREQAVISVQPFHQMQKAYEQVSLLFNCIVASMAGTNRIAGRSPGLFGPVILISREDYDRIGGHSAVRADVLDDIALGERLAGENIPARRYLGGSAIRFRMYPDGWRSLAEGFTKNFASGAMRITPGHLLLVVLWVTAMIRIPMQAVLEIRDGHVEGVLGALLLYGLMVWLIAWAGRRIGAFHPWAYLAYPVCLAGFILVFLLSLYKRLFRRPVTWKGRKIMGGQ